MEANKDFKKKIKPLKHKSKKKIDKLDTLKLKYSIQPRYFMGEENLMNPKCTAFTLYAKAARSCSLFGSFLSVCSGQTWETR